MHFLGIAPATLLWAGAALAAVVLVFYILKLRRRPVAVPFVPLWQNILRDKEATTLFSQLKRLLSLLLQWALLALLLVSLGDPRPASASGDARHVVVLIDASASMKAVDVEQPPARPEGAGERPEEAAERPVRTRLDVAKDVVRELTRGLSGSDRMLIAQMDAAVTPLSTMTGEITELEQALAEVRATDARAAFARALRFAVDSLRDLPNAEVLVVSDGALGEPVDAAGPVELGEVALSYLPVGTGVGRNVAITSFAVRRYPLDKSRYEVQLSVSNTGPEAEDVALELYGDGALSDIVRLRLASNETLSRFYPNLSGASKTLEARIALQGGGRDDLPADDRAFALLPERRRARVQLVTAGNMYLEAALLLDEYLDVVTVLPAEYPAEGRFDVTIFDAVSPPVAPGSGHRLYLDPRGEGLPFKVGKEIKSSARYTVGFDEIDTKSPLVRHLSLGDINVAKARVLEGEDGDKVVGRSFHGPLLIQGRRHGVKFAALGFDVRESDLPLRIAWPLLLLNIINDFLGEDVRYISSFRTGEVWSIPAPSSAETARVVLPSGAERVVPVKDGRAVMLGQHAGFYALRAAPPSAGEVVGAAQAAASASASGTASAAAEGSAAPSAAAEGSPAPSATAEGPPTPSSAAADEVWFAGNMVDLDESRVAPVAELRVGDRQAGAVSGFSVGVRRELWIYFLAAVLAITALEWLSYHRRVTV